MKSVPALLALFLLISAPLGGDERPRGTAAQRAHMVETQLAGRDVTNARVLAAMRKVPRHRFVPPTYREQAYLDQALPIGEEQTISQPYIVARMTELLEPQAKDKILEVGTGSGYQAAVLSELVARVFSIEIVPALALSARARLQALGYENVTVIEGDGFRGLPEQAPFDGILVTAAPAEVPEPLLQQLAPGGRLVIPVGGAYQVLKVYERGETGIRSETLFPVRFVPMTGEAQQER